MIGVGGFRDFVWNWDWDCLVRSILGTMEAEDGNGDGDADFGRAFSRE